jgi:hypothetical protein
MLNRQENVPSPATIGLHAVFEAPVLIVVAIVTPGVKPDPTTDTLLPDGPWVGVSTMVGT